MSRFEPGTCRTCGVRVPDPDIWHCERHEQRPTTTDGPRLVSIAHRLAVPVYRTTRNGLPTRINEWT